MPIYKAQWDIEFLADNAEDARKTQLAMMDTAIHNIPCLAEVSGDVSPKWKKKFRSEDYPPNGEIETFYE